MHPAHASSAPSGAEYGSTQVPASSVSVLAQLPEALRPRIWTGHQGATGPGRATGHAELDALIGGWPVGAVTELLYPDHGVGELTLLTPCMAAANTWTTWIAPPQIPYPPALVNAGVDLSRTLVVHPPDAATAGWTVEQACRTRLGSSAPKGGVLPPGHLVVAWLSERWLGSHSLRRLQLAAEAGGSIAVLMRPLQAARQPSPAALRLTVEANAEVGVDGTIRVGVLKRRGGPPNGHCHVTISSGEQRPRLSA